ncbi:MAG: 50S ribosome-binding GTPase, partial [Chloroflexota bacterium]|nr:50S ribosome-binding GTPase [Chloroflexota bacterium]
MASKPIVAIVGRPNVGKSTFFNRLIGERTAIVQDVPGTTRDRLYGEADWGGRVFTVVDTGGLDTSGSGNGQAGESIPAMVRTQAEQAIAEAD